MNVGRVQKLETKNGTSKILHCNGCSSWTGILIGYNVNLESTCCQVVLLDLNLIIASNSHF